MKQTTITDQHDVILVLGARVQKDLTPSEALRRRMTVALAWYQKRPVPIICCGAQGRDEPCAEGDFMREWFIGQGVPEDMVISESRSYDTLENIANARGIMNTHGLRYALVVTSDYHLRRSLAICRRFHVPADGFGSPSVPRYWLKNNLRELLAWVKFYMKLE